MTSESNTPGIVPPLPVWLYWTFLALTASIPVLLVSGAIPVPFDAILAALNAAFAVLTGTSRPAPAIERQAIAAEAKRRSDSPA